MPKFRSLLFILPACLGLWAPWRQAQAARAGLFVSALEGRSLVSTASSQKSLSLTLGKVLGKGALLEVPAGSMVRLKLSDRVDLALAGPARLGVRELRRTATQWIARLALESGCLYVDTRYQFVKPLDFELVLPERNLKVPPKTRWLVQAGDGKSASLTATAGANPGLCSILDPVAAQPLTLLVLGEDYDQKSKHRLDPPVLAPMLVEALKPVEGLALAKASGSAVLARRVASAFKSGGEGLARRVGRETGSRWVLVASAVASDLKVTEGRGKKKDYVQARAEARLWDVATGEPLAEDSANTRVALTSRGRPWAARQALKLASGRLASYLAAGLDGLVAGEPHSTRVVSVTFRQVSTQSGPRLKEALGRLDAVQRIMQNRFGQGILKLDLISRLPRAELEKKISGLKFPGVRLTREADTDSGGLQYRLEPEVRP